MRTGPAAGFARDRAMPGRVSDSDSGTPRAGSSARNAAEHRAAAQPVPRGGLAAMTRTKNYVAVYERDPESDAWLVHIKSIPGCATYGRTLRQAEARIREALAAVARPRSGRFGDRVRVAARTRGCRDEGVAGPSRRRVRLRRLPARRRRRRRSDSTAWASAAATPLKSSASPTSACSSCSPRSHFASQRAAAAWVLSD